MASPASRAPVTLLVRHHALEMHTFRNMFAAALAVIFPLAYLGTVRMETSGQWDSLGTWYTVYVALAVALPIALVFAAVVKILLSQWRARR